MPKTYRLSRARRLINAMFAAMTRLGIGKPYRHILTVRGRKTGRPHSTPVDVIEDGGKRWLVAGYGMTNWVRNLRAARQATISRGGRDEIVRAIETTGSATVPVLRRYYADVPVTRRYFDMTADSPDDAVLREAASHPVFEVRAHPSSHRRPSRGGPRPARSHL